MGITGTINGKYFDMNRIDEEVRLNEEEIWIVRNVGGMMQTEGHPFHVHGTQFRVLSRDGEVPPPEERGFKDTVFVEVGEEVRILVRFTHPGIFMYHCHILEHEDNGMMGQFRVE
jgi:FtsP/CotA-like multicopper oxidase with cupredoxin domain